MELRWNINGILLEYYVMELQWNITGILMEYEWNVNGI